MGAGDLAQLAVVKPTRAMALRVWWAFFWRAFLAYPVLLFLGLAAVMTPLSMAFSLDQELLVRITTAAGFALWLGLMVEAVYRVLGRRFGAFELVAVERRGQG